MAIRMDKSLAALLAEAPPDSYYSGSNDLLWTRYPQRVPSRRHR